MITLITMGQGNINALKRTVDNMSQLCDEVIFGDMLIFEEDRKKLFEIFKGYNNIWFVQTPFNFIYKNGFAHTLNELAKFAKNNLVIYMNVSEVIDKNLNKDLITDQYNCYSFNHATDPHTWVRCYDKRYLGWSGFIHEVVVPRTPDDKLLLCPEHLFMMADTEKDMDDPFKAKVFNDVKELVYFKQYLRLVETPELSPATHRGWRDWAIDQYCDMKGRMRAKGKRYEAFETGNLQMYLDDIATNPEFEQERFESSKLVNFQGNRLDIL